VTNFLEGKLQAFYKSEPIPETVSSFCVLGSEDVWMNSGLDSIAAMALFTE
jgi:hypothetical protein